MIKNHPHYMGKRWFRTGTLANHVVEESGAEMETMKFDKPTIWNVGNCGVRGVVNGNDMEVTTNSVMLSIKGKGLTRSIRPSQIEDHADVPNSNGLVVVDPKRRRLEEGEIVGCDTEPINEEVSNLMVLQKNGS